MPAVKAGQRVLGSDEGRALPRVAQQGFRAGVLRPVKLPVEQVLEDPVVARAFGQRQSGQRFPQRRKLPRPAVVDGLRFRHAGKVGGQAASQLRPRPQSTASPTSS